MIGGSGRDKDRAIFLSFTANHKFASLEVDVVTIEINELRNAQSARKQQFDDRSVAQPNFGISRNLFDHPHDLVIV